MIDLKEKATEKNLVLITGLSQSRINQMKATEVWSLEMNLEEASHSIVKWLGKRAAGHISEDGLDLVQERAKLARENRETASLKNSELRTSLVRADEIRRSIFTAARSVRNSIETISDRISSPVAGMTDQHDIHQLIDSEIRDALSNMDNEWGKIVPEENDGSSDRNTTH
tara:strand:- start:544 stop:1053 length:510 start_codon:yes stop_codon:yes gene_type:complete